MLLITIFANKKANIIKDVLKKKDLVASKPAADIPTNSCFPYITIFPSKKVKSWLLYLNLLIYLLPYAHLLLANLLLAHLLWTYIAIAASPML